MATILPGAYRLRYECKAAYVNLFLRFHPLAAVLLIYYSQTAVTCQNERSDAINRFNFNYQHLSADDHTSL